MEITSNFLGIMTELVDNTLAFIEKIRRI